MSHNGPAFVRAKPNLLMLSFFTPTGHYTGRQLSPQALAHLHVILWDQACKDFEVNQAHS